MTETANAAVATTGTSVMDAAQGTGSPGRAALLRALEELAREQGVSNVGLREVARHAGLSHAAPTHFFGSRDGMIRALAFEGLQLLDDELCVAQERDAQLPGRERLVSDAMEFVAFAQRHPAHFDAIFRTPSAAAGDDSLDRARRAALDGLRALVMEVHAAGDISGDVETVFLQLCTLSHGIASLAVDGLLKGFDKVPEGPNVSAEVVERIIRAQVAQLP
ncbi:TetR/AcrR family transcriptional regulator [Agromyces bauzanensis]|uniref:TetR family transcriptional regulator n=1 Tax=Agromyces bauzanensis TaxID=1308924 RepID=A0A917PQ87_9MICO|nr:TetR/AcrR family transcriptional regulator [Agromyces bauzanensis]GGJ87108.1 TetR family transcriptional regulator [Agromyces bauzanensis]